MEEKIRARAIIRGRVQGVFFRFETQKEARLRGVNGWVKNRSDGSVEAVFEGSRNNVESILGWCRKGPSLARVQSVDIRKQDLSEEFSGFEIRY